ncbi:glycoside hydrolase family 6 protein [Paenibacillus athensensis]|uniref:Glucanase n=1 Tax=Paenibacillus athensensis TaxID=1967502 RepID=A0A4Y8Q096_9BACL|nr:glycoside hydrolase family 6 protein [Paenibacillus athensensis]MCD1261149.1 glycoside hydrolase family 6 protein [Paenibacillus athensensis]
MKVRMKRNLRHSLLAALMALVMLGGLLAIEAPAAALESHVDNPFAGATAYVNPDYSSEVEQSITMTSDPLLQARMETIKSYPTAVWLDRIAAINPSGGRSLVDHLDQALAQKPIGGAITASFVIYNLPGRDCAALASGGELPLSAAGLARYKSEYIDVIAGIFSNPKYQDIRIVTMVEPDGLPNLTTNLSDPECKQASDSGIYVQGVQYALDKLSAIPNVYTYMDIGHSGWLGWDANLSGVVSLFTTTVQGTKKGFASVDGFVTNTSNYTPVAEPFLTNPNQSVGGSQVKTVNFYSWNPNFDESDYTAALYTKFTQAGWPSTIGFLIDTSRNGWGGVNRPAGASGSTAAAYVTNSKIDRRAHRGLWCNLNGAGLGYAPQAAPADFAASHLDAFVWNKPPGQSDGSSVNIPNSDGKKPDPNCNPSYVFQAASGSNPAILSGAMPNAPLAGLWFYDQFKMLINNAYPAVTPTPRLSARQLPGSKAELTWSNLGTGYTYDITAKTKLLTTTVTVPGMPTNLTGSSAVVEIPQIFTISKAQFQITVKNSSGAVISKSAWATITPLDFRMSASYGGNYPYFPMIAWSPVYGASYYVVERSTDKSTWINPANNYADPAVGFTDTTFEPGKIYYYRVCAAGPDRNFTDSCSAAQMVVNTKAVYLLREMNSRKMLDVNNNGTADGTKIQLWTQNNSDAQKWQFKRITDTDYTLVHVSSGKTLDVMYAGTANGTAVHLWTPNGGISQVWRVTPNSDGTLSLLNPNSNKLLTASNNGTADGTQMVVQDANASAAQKWTLLQYP